MSGSEVGVVLKQAYSTYHPRSASVVEMYLKRIQNAFRTRFKSIENQFVIHSRFVCIHSGICSIPTFYKLPALLQCLLRLVISRFHCPPALRYLAAVVLLTIEAKLEKLDDPAFKDFTAFSYLVASTL
jgi:hypothetical protein